MDKIEAFVDGDTLFTQNVDYDDLKRITANVSRHYRTSPTPSHQAETYTYDNVNQLKTWSNNGLLRASYLYDDVGNRMFAMDSTISNTTMGYTYYGGSNRLNIAQIGSSPIKWQNSYAYYEDGTLSERETRRRNAAGKYLNRNEKYYYNPFNLVRKLKYTESLSDTDCEVYDEDRRTEWSYVYSPSGERQQKRMTFNPNGDKGGFVYPWVYYLLGSDNKQHAVYHGVQLSDSLIIKSKGLLTQLSEVNPQKRYYTRPCLDYYSTLTGSATSKAVVYMYPVEYNVFGGGSSANLTYKYDSLSASWKKYYNIYDHLGNVRSVVRKNASDYTITGQFDYHPFGNTKWSYTGANAKDQRTTWIGKEKDVAENDLGDFGVRKYEYETGRFLQVDPLWEKYYPWNSYQYSMNNPVRYSDPSGKVVIAKNDAAQTAIREGVEEEYREFIEFGEDGTMDYKKMKENMPKDINPNSNFATLARLGENEAVITVEVSTDMRFNDNNGNEVRENLASIKKDGYTINASGPNAARDGRFSLDGNINIFITPNFDPKQTSLGAIFAHEMGHARFEVMGKKSSHAEKGEKPNKQLEYFIRRYEVQQFLPKEHR